MTAFVDRHGNIDPNDEYAIRTCTSDGFPILAALTYATPYIPASIGGHPDSSHPEEGGDFEWQVFMLDGRPAVTFVEKKLTRDDYDRIQQELEQAL